MLSGSSWVSRSMKHRAIIAHEHQRRRPPGCSQVQRGEARQRRAGDLHQRVAYADGGAAMAAAAAQQQVADHRDVLEALIGWPQWGQRERGVARLKAGASPGSSPAGWRLRPAIRAPSSPAGGG